MRLILPFPPSANHAYQVARGRRFRGQAYRDWSSRAAAFVKAANQTPLPPDVPVDLELVLRPPDCRTRDLDNHIKVVQDLLQAEQLISDDCWIHSLHARWWRPHEDFELKPGTCRVTVEELPL